MINQFYGETKKLLESIANGAVQSANVYAIFPREALGKQLLNELKGLGGIELSNRLLSQIKEQADSISLSSEIKLSTLLFADMSLYSSKGPLSLMAEKYASVASYFNKTLILVFDNYKGNASIDSKIEALEALPVKFEIIKTQGRAASNGRWID